MATGRVPTTANSPLTAKGDLFTYSTAPARLAVGNNGETIVADSSTSTGLRYQASMAAGRNAVINGGMDIWQRGTSISLAANTSNANGYSADRWDTYTQANQALTISRQATSDTTNLPYIQYCLRYQRNSGQTGTTALILASAVESINSIPFAGKTVVMSFWARAGANYSAASSQLVSRLYSGTSTDGNILNTWAGPTIVASNTATLTTTWQQFYCTGTVASTATQVSPYFSFTPVGTAGVNDYYEITGVQIELGAIPTAFTRTGGNIQGELAACQRYYTRVLASSGSNYYYYALGTAKSSTVAKIAYTMPMTMRVSPTAVEYSGLSLYDTVNAAIAVTAVTTDTPTLNNYSMDITVASGLTQYRPYYLFANNQSGGYFGLTAEL